MREIDGDCYLNRAEAIGYLLHAYNVKWCMTRWSRHTVAFSLEAEDGTRLRRRVSAFMTRNSRIARVRKEDLDDFFASEVRDG